MINRFKERAQAVRNRPMPPLEGPDRKRFVERMQLDYQDFDADGRTFLQRYGVQNDRANLTFSPAALRALNMHTWPGNVRELQNRVKRAVIMADGKRITEKDLELTAAAGAGRATLKEVRESVERDLVRQALKRHFGKISSAAAELGVSRPTLYELMEKLGVDRSAAKAE
jgi:two-component system NtrC family response regulator